MISLRPRFTVVLGTLVFAASLGVAACDTPTSDEPLIRKDHLRAAALQPSEADVRVAALQAQSESSRRTAQESLDAAWAASEELARKSAGRADEDTTTGSQTNRRVEIATAAGGRS
jgi:hypothetical protein